MESWGSLPHGKRGREIQRGQNRLKHAIYSMPRGFLHLSQLTIKVTDGLSRLILPRGKQVIQSEKTGEKMGTRAICSVSSCSKERLPHGEFLHRLTPEVCVDGPGFHLAR